jgi:hypothetical protein
MKPCPPAANTLLSSASKWSSSVYPNGRIAD